MCEVRTSEVDQQWLIQQLMRDVKVKLSELQIRLADLAFQVYHLVRYRFQE